MSLTICTYRLIYQPDIPKLLRAQFFIFFAALHYMLLVRRFYPKLHTQYCGRSSQGQFGEKTQRHADCSGVVSCDHLIPYQGSIHCATRLLAQPCYLLLKNFSVCTAFVSKQKSERIEKATSY